MKKEREKLTREPAERAVHRATCKHMGYCGNCYKRSGYFKIGDGVGHILMGCDGKCRRMVIWDNKHGYKGVEFKLEVL